MKYVVYPQQGYFIHDICTHLWKIMNLTATESCIFTLQFCHIIIIIYFQMSATF
jgi:hypothetical protein